MKDKYPPANRLAQTARNTRKQVLFISLFKAAPQRKSHNLSQVTWDGAMKWANAIGCNGIRTHPFESGMGEAIAPIILQWTEQPIGNSRTIPHTPRQNEIP